MPAALTPAQHSALQANSRGTLGADELRGHLDDATYGDVLRMLGAANWPLPRTSPQGREATLVRVRLAVPDE